MKAIVLAACAACVTPTPPAPVVAPVAVHAVKVPSSETRDLENRAIALDRMRDKLAAVTRTRARDEAPLEITNAFVDLEFAYGYARLGRRERAEQLQAAARTALVNARPVAKLALDLYDARIAQALAGEREFTPLPLPLEARIKALYRSDRYALDSLRSRSRLLAPDEPIDAVRWSRVPHPTDVARGLADDARAHELGVLIDKALPLPPADRAPILTAVLPMLASLPPHLALPLYDRALPGLDTPELAATAMYVAARLQSPDRSRALLPAALDIHTTATAARTIELTLRALHEFGTLDDVADALGKLAPQLDPRDDAALIALAAGWFIARDATRARELLASVDVVTNRVLAARLELTREMAFAYANASLDAAEPGLQAAVVDHFADVTDSNRYFCVAVIDAVEQVVLGLVPYDLRY